jgi:hypothetical protein
LTESGLRRHYNRHVTVLALDPDPLDDPTVTDLTRELVAVLNDASRVRREASRAGRGDLVLKASATTRATVETLIGSLGISDADVLKDLELSEALARAVASVIKKAPVLGPLLGDRLRELGQDQAAQDVESFAASAAKTIEEKRTA